MASSSDFGKDMGVVWEAVITGRKAGADKDFWAILAHNEELFRRIVPIVRHVQELQAIGLELHELHVPSISECRGTLQVFFDKIRDAVGGNYSLGFNDGMEEKWDRAKDKLAAAFPGWDRDRSVEININRQLTNVVMEMSGISASEFFDPKISITMEPEVLFATYGIHLKPEEFISMMEKVILRRQIIALMFCK
ncbi:hypothetical protein KW782_01280 [Candidatus Parcubacteria bacterium]|nr:hypothetical protein [Candidatus Parcubacteria bacterium]